MKKYQQYRCMPRSTNIKIAEFLRYPYALDTLELFRLISTS
jgi:hypothetical protein